MSATKEVLQLIEVGNSRFFKTYVLIKSQGLNIMNKFNMLVVFLLTMLIAGCAGGTTSESTGEYLDNYMLTTKVKTSILGDSRLKLLQINVESFKGVVQLSGFVDSASAATRAVELARTVKGVKSVNNSLIVK